MLDYVNHQFNCIISDKDADENFIIFQPVPENFRSLKKLVDFLKAMELKKMMLLWKNSNKIF